MLVTVDKAYELSLRGACSVSRDMKRLFVPRSNGNIVAVTEQLNLCHALFLVNGATSFVQTPASATPTGQLPSLLRFQQILNPAREYTNVRVFLAGINFVLHQPRCNARYT